MQLSWWGCQVLIISFNVERSSCRWDWIRMSSDMKSGISILICAKESTKWPTYQEPKWKTTTEWTKKHTHTVKSYQFHQRNWIDNFKPDSTTSLVVSTRLKKTLCKSTWIMIMSPQFVFFFVSRKKKHIYLPKNYDFQMANKNSTTKTRPLQELVQGAILVAPVDSQCLVKKPHDLTVEVYSTAPAGRCKNERFRGEEFGGCTLVVDFFF